MHVQEIGLESSLNIDDGFNVRQEVPDSETLWCICISSFCIKSLYHLPAHVNNIQKLLGLHS
jgi:hypothetical protein